MAQGTEYNVEYHATNSGWHKFSRMELLDDNLMYIKATTDPISENCTDAFEFEPAMIVDGEVLVNEWWSELNPRSCIGQSDKYEILMLVIEGRGASGSWGTDIAHCAEILKNHNCEQAINVDGGQRHDVVQRRVSDALCERRFFGWPSGSERLRLPCSRLRFRHALQRYPIRPKYTSSSFGRNAGALFYL